MATRGHPTRFLVSEAPPCQGYKDCGTCRCVPESTCQWCPGAYTPALPSATPNNSVIRPSSVFGCPASFKEMDACGEPGVLSHVRTLPFVGTAEDCGTCLCVPEGSCQYCPGVAAPATPAVRMQLAQSKSNIRPSSIIGCPLGTLARDLAGHGLCKRWPLRLQGLRLLPLRSGVHLPVVSGCIWACRRRTTLLERI